MTVTRLGATVVLLLLGGGGDVVAQPDPFQSAAPPTPRPAIRPRTAPALEAPAPPPARPDPEATLWRTAVASDSRADFEAYLRAYPNGQYAQAARSRIAALTPALVPPAAIAPAPPPPVPAQPAPAGALIVAAGQELLVRAHQQWNGACIADESPEVAIVAPPSGGSVQVREGSNLVGNTTSGNAICNGMRLRGAGVYYRARADFRGLDRFEYAVTFRSLVVRRFTIVVQVQ
jgi:hypothetical protein